MQINEIEELKDSFVQHLNPERIYLFGSFATGDQTEDSDYDFYIVVKDNVNNIADLTTRAYKAIRHIKRRPVDILVGTSKRFDERKKMLTVEREVDEKGVLIYGQ